MKLERKLLSPMPRKKNPKVKLAFITFFVSKTMEKVKFYYEIRFLILKPKFGVYSFFFFFLIFFRVFFSFCQISPWIINKRFDGLIRVEIWFSSKLILRCDEFSFADNPDGDRKKNAFVRLCSLSGNCRPLYVPFISIYLIILKSCIF